MERIRRCRARNIDGRWPCWRCESTTSTRRSCYHDRLTIRIVGCRDHRVPGVVRHSDGLAIAVALSLDDGQLSWTGEAYGYRGWRGRIAAGVALVYCGVACDLTWYERCDRYYGGILAVPICRWSVAPSGVCLSLPLAVVTTDIVSIERIKSHSFSLVCWEGGVRTMSWCPIVFALATAVWTGLVAYA